MIFLSLLLGLAAGWLARDLCKYIERLDRENY
jgi:hypothetical protein